MLFKCLHVHFLHTASNIKQEKWISIVLKYDLWRIYEYYQLCGIEINQIAIYTACDLCY